MKSFFFLYLEYKKAFLIWSNSVEQKKRDTLLHCISARTRCHLRLYCRQFFTSLRFAFNRNQRNQSVSIFFRTSYCLRFTENFTCIIKLFGCLCDNISCTAFIASSSDLQYATRLEMMENKWIVDWAMLWNFISPVSKTEEVFLSI